jgi:pyrroline-5-carboxylate reductase
MKKWYFLGSGHMARAFMQGLMLAGVDAEQIYALSQTGVSSKKCQEDLGVNYLDHLPVLRTNDVCVLAMKPQQFHALMPADLKNIGEDSLVFSILAGVDIKLIESKVKTVKIIRHMPNLAVAYCAQGATTFRSQHLSVQDQEYFDQILKQLGHNTWVEDENLITDTTVHCSSMLAHHFDVAHQICEHLKFTGLDAREAKIQAMMSFQAAAILMFETEHSFLELKKNVVSKAGVTHAFLESLKENGFSEIFEQALKAGQDRARELKEKM